MYPKLNINVDFSRADLSRGITLPNELTLELAELVGVIMGDGHIYFNNESREKTNYSIWISGSLSEDSDYYKNYINKIFQNLFNLDFSFASQRKDELIVRVHSKAIASFFKDFGIKTGNKTSDNPIPNEILNSNDNIKKGFLRGIFDTEFCVMFKKDHHGKHSKPIISTKMKSLKLVLHLKDLLESFGFKVGVYKDEYFDKRSKDINTGYRIQIAGKKSFKHYLEVIGFRNPRHLTKVEIWNKFGFCPPRLSYQQRLDILRGKIDPYKFY